MGTVVNAIAVVNAKATAQKPNRSRPARVPDMGWLLLISVSNIRPRAIGFNAKAS